MQYSNSFKWTLETIDVEANIGLYSWTFDPSHNGHFEVMKEATWKVDFLIVNPCDRNQDKISIRSNLDIRKRWLELWVYEYWYEDYPIVMLDDHIYRSQAGTLDVAIRWNAWRVQKIIWPDKDPAMHPFPLIIWEERVEWRSSSKIKERFRVWDIEWLELIMPQSIVSDILESKHIFR